MGGLLSSRRVLPRDPHRQPPREPEYGKNIRAARLAADVPPAVFEESPTVSLPPLVEPAVTLTRDEVMRYSRHLIIPEVATAGQKRMKNAKVLAVGAGGLGSPTLMYLAAAGVGAAVSSWYVGDRMNTSDVGTFTDRLATSLPQTISSAATPPGSSGGGGSGSSSSGSSGGGSSGGGGGGGGGSGW